MLYYQNQVSRPLFEGVTLTNAFTGNRKSFETEGFSKIAIDIGYVMGGAESDNTLELQLEASSDNVNWYSLVIDSSDSISVITDRQWQMAPGNRNIFVDIGYKFMRASVKESGVAANAGTASVTITLSGL